MVFSSAGAPGSQDNRIGEAEALSVFVQNDVSVGRLTVTPGVRYERIDLTRTDFAAGDLARTGQGRTVRENTVEAVIPGIGARFDLDADWSLFGGVHRGFAPPGPGSASDPEDAVNWELGARWMRGAWFAEATGFYNDYSNLVGSCTASTGGGCVIGDQFDGGEVRVRGLELSGGTDLGAAMGLAVGLPVRAAYTWTDAEFQTAFQSGYGPWGSVQAGDALPYLAEHQLFVSAGVEYGRFGGELALTWVGDRRIVAGQGSIPEGERLDSHAIADLSAWYDVTDAVRARVQVRNLTDETYAASRSPAGLRPGAPRAVLFGLSYDF
jgi:Fe(3+) dicitrate transport protein